MKFVPLSIAGAYRIDPEPHKDDRGTFVRLFCSEEFAGQGLEFTTSQINLSANTKSHTLRGLHFHAAPYAESKLVRVVRGRAFDVIVDLRPESPSYKCWDSLDLDSDSLAAVFIPEGCAHGFLTLQDDTALLYQMGRPFVPGFDRGIRWNDPAFGIAWPAAPAIISERDAGYPDFG